MGEPHGGRKARKEGVPVLFSLPLTEAEKTTLSRTGEANNVVPPASGGGSHTTVKGFNKILRQ